MPRRRHPSPRTRHPRETCRTGKKVYATDIEALEELVAIAHRPELLDRPKQEGRAYGCPLCNGYHLTSKPAHHERF